MGKKICQFDFIKAEQLFKNKKQKQSAANNKNPIINRRDKLR